MKCGRKGTLERQTSSVVVIFLDVCLWSVYTIGFIVERFMDRQYQSFMIPFFHKLSELCYLNIACTAELMMFMLFLVFNRGLVHRKVDVFTAAAWALSCAHLAVLR
jgi:hypothetical protein